MPLNATTSVPVPLTGPSWVAIVVSRPSVNSENAARHVSTAQIVCFSMVIGTCFDGARVSHDPRLEAFVVEADADGRTHSEDLFVAGDITGAKTAREAAASGTRAAQAVKEALR